MQHDAYCSERELLGWMLSHLWRGLQGRAGTKGWQLIGRSRSSAALEAPIRTSLEFTAKEHDSEYTFDHCVGGLY
eukprot:9176257-Alexandrium_andersonii.AAC.1